ncbi:MAG: hypothetical protein JOY54_20235 [Acidobacteriaceae bacterium]|nr:hypothetical protein [Acidobacteriaceae bacterium]
MSIGQHAENILSAWHTADYGRLEVEVGRALLRCQTVIPRSELEYEQHEVLHSIAQRLREMGYRSSRPDMALSAVFLLLQHIGTNSAATTPSPQNLS